MEVLDRFKGVVPGLVGVVILVEDTNYGFDIVNVYLIGAEMKNIWFTMNKERFEKGGLDYLLECYLWLESEEKGEVRVDTGTMVFEEVMEMWRSKNVVNYRYKDMIKRLVYLVANKIEIQKIGLFGS